MTELTPPAVEGDSYPIRFVITDRVTGDAVVPDTLTWTLTDDAGAVVNSREDVALTPASTVYVVPRGADLAVGGDAPVTRVLTLEGTYSSSYGTGLPIRREVRFQVLPTAVSP